ncbi:ABC transporter substrate-binding protein [Pseudooceanicola sp.]|uniref:ABC transporter substrate-binding protein n=1 Tax=Pseudooceanicola sp. TaxID=1914328 RepID=UPI0035175856
MLKHLTIAAAIAAASASGAMAEQVKLGLQPWLGYGPLWVAEEKGFFDKHGVDVELSNFNWDQDMLAALASGNLHVIAGATNGVITSYNQGVDQRGFMIMDLAFEADAIIAGNDINSISDLAGKKIAFESGTTSDLLLNYALRENGMSISDIEHVPMGASEAGLALVSGRVDVAVSYEPYISAALAKSDSNKVLYTAAEKPGLISDLLTARSDWIEANPDVVRGLILAWDDAVTFIRENPEEGQAMIADAVGAKRDYFAPAWAGVRLYNIEEMIEFYNGGFQETVTEIGEILKEAKPEEITKVPTADDILMLDVLLSMQN